MTEDQAIKEIHHQLDSIRKVYKPLNSYHEAYGVLMEEIEELFDEIKKKPSMRSVAAIREEAAQIAAVCIRTMIDLNV